MIFESHAHYDDEAFQKDVHQLIPYMKEQGISYIINIGASIASSKGSLELSAVYPHVYAALGVHPSETGTLTEEDFQWLKEHLRGEKVVALGEIGLDYYWDEPDRKIQQHWFQRQMELAIESKLPMVIHSRDAAHDTYQMMKEAGADKVGGVVHCFSYGKEMARDFLNLDYHLGIGGVITFKNGKKLREVVEYMPLNRILLETDSPYLSPEPNRGKRNNSLNLTFVAKEIANLKQVSYEEVLAVTMENAKKLFRMEN